MGTALAWGIRSGPRPSSETRQLLFTAVALSLVSSSVCLLVVAILLPPHASLWRVLMRWDASWYRNIALHGYSWNPHSPLQQNPNFFPLYPLFERAAHLLTGLPISRIAVGSSIVFQAVAAALLVLVARGQGASGREALAWLTMFLVSPPVVVDIMGYYSALFCVLCFLALFFAQRHRPWLVALVVGLASGANPLGVAFAVGFVVWELNRLVSTRSISWRSLAMLASQALVSVSGLLGYALYLLVAFRDPIAFYQATKGWSVPVPPPCPGGARRLGDSDEPRPIVVDAGPRPPDRGCGAAPARSARPARGGLDRQDPARSRGRPALWTPGLGADARPDVHVTTPGWQDRCCARAGADRLPGGEAAHRCAQPRRHRGPDPLAASRLSLVPDRPELGERRHEAHPHAPVPCEVGRAPWSQSPSDTGCGCNCRPCLERPTLIPSSAAPCARRVGRGAALLPFVSAASAVSLPGRGSPVKSGAGPQP